MSFDSQTLHGGPDALGAPLHDFSTNVNACGPCPAALTAVQAADAARYPDPHYTELRERLGQHHGVAATRIVLAASASEFIHRITALAQLRGASAVALPAHSYGDYAQAAQARGLSVLRPADAGWNAAELRWACEPSSPLGGLDPALLDWTQKDDIKTLRVVDCAYRPLMLAHEAQDASPMPPAAWQLWTPNKALGMTGVRAAYAVAPVHVLPQDLQALNALAPSWPVGAHGVAMLHAWTTSEVQQCLARSRVNLREWKHQQQAMCTELGWTVAPGSLANYFVAQPRVNNLPDALAALRACGIKLRDAYSFGLPGHVRLGVLPPASQQALMLGWQAVRG